MHLSSASTKTKPVYDGYDYIAGHKRRVAEQHSDWRTADFERREKQPSSNFGLQCILTVHRVRK